MNIIKVLGIAAGVAATGLASLAIANAGNVAETSADSKDESLKTRRYQVDLKTFVEETERLILALTTYGQNWRIISADVAESSATVKAEVPVVFFTDDLEISAKKEADKEEITVDVRSASRVGKGDLGENRRHILQILKALDEKFAGK
ncbi:hypothetical protein BH24ACI2_BH24ACI2_16100 [soil metagenome]|jgi:uncharacterized protein (DUF1499 family)|nr:DUF1499 domain-containing protein [Acidobacteriota bacterium]